MLNNLVPSQLRDLSFIFAVILILVAWKYLIEGLLD